MFTYLEVLLCAYLCSCNERGIHSALLTQAFSVSCESQLKILKRTFGRKGEYWEYFEIFTLNLGWITIKEVYVGSHWVAEGIPFKKKMSDSECWCVSAKQGEEKQYLYLTDLISENLYFQVKFALHTESIFYLNVQSHLHDMLHEVITV